MTARPRSWGATIAAALMTLAAVITVMTGLPPLGKTQPPVFFYLAVMLAANMLWIAWGTHKLEGVAWLCAMLLFGATGAFTVAILVVGPRPPIAWTHALLSTAIMACLALPSVRTAFTRARAIRGVVPKP